MDFFIEITKPIQTHSIKSDIVILVIIISLLILAVIFKIYTINSEGRTDLPRDKKGAFFSIINDAPGICIFVHASKLKQNPIPLLEPNGIPENYYFLQNRDSNGKEYVGALPPEVFVRIYKRAYDIKKYNTEQLSTIFNQTLELQKDIHSQSVYKEFNRAYYERNIKWAFDQLSGINFL